MTESCGPVGHHLLMAEADETPAVLVADDDPDTRAALRLMLEDAGYVVLEVEDGVATLDALLLSPRRLVVLLDLLMPRVSGYEALLQVAADTLLRERHAYIILTATHLSDPRIGPRFTELVEQLGALVVAKPFDVEELLDCVARHWRRLSGRLSGTEASDASQTG